MIEQHKFVHDRTVNSPRTINFLILYNIYNILFFILKNYFIQKNLSSIQNTVPDEKEFIKNKKLNLKKITKKINELIIKIKILYYLLTKTLCYYTCIMNIEKILMFKL
jgi:hypothetical protein